MVECEQSFRTGSDNQESSEFLENHQADADFQKSYLRKVLQIGKSTFELLQKLHGEGIIHGDLHWNNVAFLYTQDGHEGGMRLIDLGLAAVVSSNNLKDLDTPPNLNMAFFAPWQFLGGPRGYRDDVFRNIEQMARFMSRQKLAKYSVDVDSKKTFPYFGRRQRYDCSDSYPDIARIIPQLSAAMTELLEYARGMQTYDEFPDYNRILGIIDNAIAMLHE